MKVRWGTVVTLLLGAGTAVQLLQQRNAWCLPGGTLGLCRTQRAHGPGSGVRCKVAPDAHWQDLRF